MELLPSSALLAEWRQFRGKGRQDLYDLMQLQYYIQYMNGYDEPGRQCS